jgi:hypothetical protein
MDLDAWLRQLRRSASTCAQMIPTPPPSATRLGRIVRAEVARLLTSTTPLPKARGAKWRATEWTIRLPRDCFDNFMLITRLRSLVYNAACSVGANIAALHVRDVEYLPSGSISLRASVIAPQPPPNVMINVRWASRTRRRYTL